MGSEDLFGGVLETARKALDLRAKRHRLIVSNLANADTPGYKAFDIEVEKALQKQSGASRAMLRLTDPRHLAAADSAAAGPLRYEVQIDEQVTLRGDGNTVDMEREMTNLASNSLMYKATAQILTKKIQLLKSVIQGGKR